MTRMHYRIETCAMGRWTPFTITPFADAAAAERHRVEVIAATGCRPDAVRVAPVETHADLRARLIETFRLAHPAPEDPESRARENAILRLVPTEALEAALRGPSDDPRIPHTETRDAATHDR